MFTLFWQLPVPFSRQFYQNVYIHFTYGRPLQESKPQPFVLFALCSTNWATQENQLYIKSNTKSVNIVKQSSLVLLMLIPHYWQRCRQYTTPSEGTCIKTSSWLWLCSVAFVHYTWSPHWQTINQSFNSIAGRESNMLFMQPVCHGGSGWCWTQI
jgi:hypothetical protein